MEHEYFELEKMGRDVASARPRDQSPIDPLA